MEDEIKISFRIGRPYSGMIREQAQSNCVSVNQIVRMTLIGVFENQDALDIKDEVIAMHEKLRQFQAAFEDALE